METGLLHLHSILRWVILALLLVSIITTYSATTNANKKWWLFTLIASHIMLLIGLYQWFLGRYSWGKIVVPEGTSIMKDKFARFYLIEHPTLMILGILLITLAYGKTKKGMYKRAFQLFLIALIVILVAVPWPFRDIVGRAWFPGM